MRLTSKRSRFGVKSGQEQQPCRGPPGGQPVFSSSYFKGRFPFWRFQRKRRGKRFKRSCQPGVTSEWKCGIVAGGTLSSLPLGPSRTNAEGHLCSESVTALEVSGGAGNSVFIFLSRFGLKKHQSVQERTQKFSWRAGLTRPAPGMECSLWGCWVRADTPFICCPRRSHWEETHPGLSHHTPREAGLAARGVTGLAGLIPDASVLERSVHHGPSDPPRSSLRQEMTESHAEVPAHSRGALLACSNEAPILRPATCFSRFAGTPTSPKTGRKEASPTPTPYLTRSYQNSAFPSHCWDTGKCW